MIARAPLAAVGIVLALGAALAVSPARAERLIVSVSNHRVTVTRWLETETINRSARAGPAAQLAPSSSVTAMIMRAWRVLIRRLRCRGW